MGQKFAAYNAQGAITAFYDDAVSPPPADVAAIEITDAEWVEAIAGGYTVANGELVAPAAPTAAEQLATAQVAQTALISAACANAIGSGFTSSALGSAYSYPSKSTDQQNLASSVLSSLMPNLAATWTTPFWCADSTGAWAFRNHTAAQIQQVGQDGKTAILACMTKNQALAEEIAAATSIAAVQAIVWG
jgi:hypothetical protein